jgi:hypothetical protein
MPSEGYHAHIFGCNSPLQFKIAFWSALKLLGRVWQLAENYYDCLARFKLKKSAPNGHYYVKSSATPDQITQQNTVVCRSQ